MYTPASPHKAECFPVTKMVRYRAKRYGHISGEAAMMKELMNGPITCGIACSNSFTYEYKAGIHHDTTGFMDIDHDVEVVGWGEENGVKYWHARNSWGTYWGMNGFFKIIRGINNLGIEADCAFVEVDITEEELIWEEKPVYGGSIFGIVPFNEKEASEHPISDTTDITSHSTNVQDKAQPNIVLANAATALPTNNNVLGHAALFFVAGCVCTLMVAMVVARTRFRRVVYRPIQ